MTDHASQELQPGEYLLSDPLLLQGMRLSQDIKVPGGIGAILLARYTPITANLIERLRKHGVETLFAEPIQEQSVVSSVEQMERMFAVIEDIVSRATRGLDDVGEALQNRQQIRLLESLMQSNLSDIESLFSADPTEKLLALTQHHNGTARHSIVASFHMMAIGRELGWNGAKIVRGAMAAFTHDIGKTAVKLETLDCPGRLDGKQWQEMQLHSLMGGRLLYRRGEAPDLPMLTALLHHEWYADVKGKGYGGLSLFANHIRKSLQLDIPKIVSELDPDDLDIIQATALVDMVSALEERRAYKRELDSFKVLVIMNSDASLGHFNPRHYAAWHRIYLRQYPNLLPRERRVALPREKERRIFQPNAPKKVPPVELLTFREMERLGIMTLLGHVGMDVERIRRRGGLLLKILNQIKKEKNLDFDCSVDALLAAGINPVKEEIVTEQEMIELDVWREWLTWDELEKSGLSGMAKMHQFDIGSIQKEGGISPERLNKRGVPVNWKKLERLGIQPLKRWTARLPGSEHRLTPEDLNKLGIGEGELARTGCLERVKKIKSGVPLTWLRERGLAIPNAALSKNGIDPVRKVFYDIQVTEEISQTRAKFLLLREGDDLKSLIEANERSELEPIQDLLLNKVGEVVMDFTELVALPDLSRTTQGPHWNR
ncbi:MAG: hypothetical protein HQL57_08070 [Magnetococcales bacterium]|nr:hypothetical protein [Magnetococcales bacterium]